jgi:pimeloyl-ACP methyl ester carboxylesterase
MDRLFTSAVALAASLLVPAVGAQTTITKPTVVLVHGAFADSSSWNGVTGILERHGYTVIAAPNPLRGVASDAGVISDVVKSIAGPVVLVGHSYGGSVISEAAEGRGNVKALVYVSAFAPDTGETALDLTGKFPGSTLGAALAPPVQLTSGGKDLYIQQARFHDQFAADVPPAAARLMAAGQRPVAEAALSEPATAPAWKHLPTWFIFGDKDKNIPPAAMKFMAERAHARDTVVIKGGSHVVLVSNAPAVAKLIEQAATAS